MNPDSNDAAGMRRSRLALDAVATLHAAGTPDMQVRVIDASLSGVRLTRPAALGLALGQSIDMSLQARERRVQHLTGRVVRVGHDEFAVEFDRIDAAAAEELGWLIERFGTLLE